MHPDKCETPNRLTGRCMKDQKYILSLLPEKSADRLSMVHTADGFGEHGPNFQNFQLGAQAAVFILRNAIRYDDLVQSGGINSGNGIATEYAVGEQSINVGCSLLLQQLGRSSNCVGCIRKIVDQDSNSVGNLSDQHHGGVLAIGNAGGSTFLGDMSVRKFREMGVLPCGSMRIPYSGRPQLPLLSSHHLHQD